MRCPFCAEDLPPGAGPLCPHCGSLVQPLPATPAVKGAIFRLAGQHHLLGAMVRRGHLGVVTVPIKWLNYAIWDRDNPRGKEPLEEFDLSPQGWQGALARLRSMEPVIWSVVAPPACVRCGKPMRPLGAIGLGGVSPSVIPAQELASVQPRDPMYTFRCSRCNIETMG